MSKASILLLVHAVVAAALLGAITHQTLAAWARASSRPNIFFGRFRTVPSARFASAVVVLYVVCATLGAVVYLDFRVDIRPRLEQGYWPMVGIFDIKEHFVSIGLGLLPAYWLYWRQASAADSSRSRVALTTIIAIIVWWSFLVGHIVNDVVGFGS